MAGIWVCPRCDAVHDPRKMDLGEMAREDCTECVAEGEQA
jgi:hypothetical protein